MAYAFNGTNQHLSTASAPASGYPMTLALWYRLSSLVTSRVMTVGAANGDRHQLQVNTQFSQASAVTVAGGGASAVAAGGAFTYATNAWYHHAGVFSASDSRSVWMNGSLLASDASDRTPGTFDRVTIGAGAVPAGLFFAGDIAEVGVWSAALTAAEIASLAQGISPSLVRPQSLVFYAPLVRDLIDVRGGLTITNNNTATVADHPRIYA
jgi:hypothetical protein